MTITHVVRAVSSALVLCLAGTGIALAQADRLPEAIMVDCSHGNSWKKFQGQEMAWRSVVDQRLAGNDALVALMLESYLGESNQKFTGNPADLAYGVSITDACLNWETTERMLRWGYQALA